MGYVEDLILSHPCRGMDILRPHLAEDFCREAADEILSWRRGTVLQTTGFYVAGRAETDGPPGALLLAKTLEAEGFQPVVVTDELCRGYFERGGVPSVYLPLDATEDDCMALLEELAPVGMISVERCGKNTAGDYANMRGVSISKHTAPIDRLFELAQVPTIGIGDGGNEIGMGNLAGIIRNELALTPCRITVDQLVIATVSNWGALGLCACLGRLPTEKELENAYILARDMGYVDGLAGECALSEDGFPLEVVLKLRDELEATVMAADAGFHRGAAV